MNELLMNVLSVIISAIVLPLISIGGSYLIKLINTKIKNQESAKLLTDATTIILNAVRTISQTYVESLKAAGKFDEASQKLALLKAKNIALDQMSKEVKGFITESFGDLDSWITNQIEASINLLRRG